MKALISGGAQCVLKQVPAILNQKLAMTMGLGKMDESMRNIDETSTLSYDYDEESEYPSIIEKSYMDKFTEKMTMDYYFEDKKANASINLKTAIAAKNAKEKGLL